MAGPGDVPGDDCLGQWVPRLGSQTNARLTSRIRESFATSDRTYGSPRVWRDLQDWGEDGSENQVARLMQAAQLKAHSKRRRLPGDTGQRPEYSIAANLPDRHFKAGGPHQRWVADFTYVWTAEGWLAVCGGSGGLVLAPCGGLVHEFGHDGAIGHLGLGDNAVQKGQVHIVDASP